MPAVLPILLALLLGLAAVPGQDASAQTLREMLLGQEGTQDAAPGQDQSQQPEDGGAGRESEASPAPVDPAAIEAGTGAAATIDPIQRGAPQPFGFLLTQWNQTLTEVENAAAKGSLSAQEGLQLRTRLMSLRSEIEKARARITSELQPLRRQLEALGPPPQEGEPPETTDVAAQRESLKQQIALLDGHIKQSDLVAARITSLDNRIASYEREATFGKLLEQFPHPLTPETMGRALPEFLGHLGQMARAPFLWWNQLSAAQQEEVLYYRFLVILGVALILGWVLRRILMSRFGRDPARQSPSYTRRLAAAIAEGLGNGLIPALIFGGLLYRTLERQTLFSGLFGDMLAAFAGAMIFLILAWALSRAALAPDLPAWRLERFRPEAARQLHATLVLLAAVVALDGFLRASMEGLAVSRQLESLYQFATSLVEGGLIVVLMRRALWEREPVPEEAEEEEGQREEDDDDDAVSPSAAFWITLRLVIVGLAATAVLASLLGYANLSNYLMRGLALSGAIVGGLYVMRGLLRELVGASLRSDLATQRLALPHGTRRLLKFWIRMLVDLAVAGFTLFLLLPAWGVPLADMLNWTGRTLQGFSVGNVRISITDVLTALVIFGLATLVTRAIQRVLSQRILPRTNLDSGVQNSISAGLGYVGVGIAIMLGISAVGLDLSNLAIIAGALSVGIGFGLQNVVNNFVSGLILLIERPIKVGDWIVAAGHEGYVKRISVRATEMETFQRASVIIPNSELISSSVVNRTHKNKLGRVEVPVGVAYGSDVDKVMALLKDCLKADSRILNWPEPYVVFQAFGDSSLNFEARGYIADVDYVLIISSDIRVAIHRALVENDIEIPFPQRDVTIKHLDSLVAAIEGRRRQEEGKPKPEQRPDPSAESEPGPAESESGGAPEGENT